MSTQGHRTPYFSWYLPIIWTLDHCWSNSNLATHIMPTRGHRTYPFLLVPTYDLNPILLLVQLKFSHMYHANPGTRDTPFLLVPTYDLSPIPLLVQLKLSHTYHANPGTRDTPFLLVPTYDLSPIPLLVQLKLSHTYHANPGTRDIPISPGTYLWSEPYTTVGPTQT